jgi:ubiquinone/menaquinone biosynthesis C-methylase UbiE
MDAIGLEPGMVIGEVGAGQGRFSVRLAERVGERGKVYANDIDEEALEYLERRCRRDEIHNLETILGEVVEPKFPASTLDMAFMINTYHHLEDPVGLLKNVVPALKADGKLVIVEHDPKKTGPGWESDSTPREELLEEVRQAGYEVEEIIDESSIPQDVIYVLRPSRP